MSYQRKGDEQGNAPNNGQGERLIWGFNTSWMRRRYVIDGGSLRPYLGSTSSKAEPYNPFAHYSPGDDDSLYLRLLRLDLNDEEAIEKFASQWGLLGIFPHRVVQLRQRIDSATLGGDGLPSQEDWYFSPDGTEIDKESGRPSEVAVLREMLRTGQATITVDGKVEAADGQDLDKIREITTAKLAADRAHEFWDGIHKLSSVMVQDEWAIREMWAEPFATTYFPRLDLYEWWDASFTSERFWDGLCEPVQEFRMAAYEFRRIFRICASAQETRSDDLGRTAASLINQHRQRVHPVIQFLPKTGEWRESWSFPSLLSALYQMLHQDLTEHMYARFCTRCRKPLMGQRAHREYCSRACLDAEKQARYRRLKKLQKGGEA